MAALPIELDRAARMPLATRSTGRSRDAIEEGWLDPGAKFPSWRDMAAQLGVWRGAVRVAYRRLTLLWHLYDYEAFVYPIGIQWGMRCVPFERPWFGS
jgi:hypothetical protein